MFAARILIPFIILVVFASVVLILLTVAWVAYKRNRVRAHGNTVVLKVKDAFNLDSNWVGAAAIFGFMTAFTLVALVVSLIPFNAKYWTYETRSGTIETIDVRAAISDSETTLTGEYAVILNDDKEVLIATDPRLQTYKVGDKVEFICGWEWVYAGSDKLNCNLNG